MTWLAAPSIVASWSRTSRPTFHSERLLVAESLYTAISKVSGSDVVVDSSKWPLDPLLLYRARGFQLRVVHLVRDPRAVAYSWTRTKRFKDGSGRPMDRHSATHSSLSWLVRNISVELSRSLTSVPATVVRYEDLVAEPAATMEALAAFIGQASTHLPWLSSNSATLTGLHLVAGNPDRPMRGRLDVINDETWRRRLPASKARLVAALTSPLMRRYDYR